MAHVLPQPVVLAIIDLPLDTGHLLLQIIYVITADHPVGLAWNEIGMTWIYLKTANTACNRKEN
jgi:hypothetical protein